MCIVYSNKVHPSSERELESLHIPKQFFFFNSRCGTGTYSIFSSCSLPPPKKAVLSGISYFAVCFLIFREAIKQIMPKPFFSYIVHVNGILHCLLNHLAVTVDGWGVIVLSLWVSIKPWAMVCSGECGICRRSLRLGVQ